MSARVRKPNAVPAALANFNDYEGDIVGKSAVPPRSYTFEDRLAHLRQRKLCRIGDELRKPFSPKHFLLTVKYLDEAVRVEYESISRGQLYFVRGLGWCCFIDAPKDSILRLE
jgi:hypothetical protein